MRFVFVPYKDSSWVLFVSVNVDLCLLSVWRHSGHNFMNITFCAQIWMSLLLVHRLEFHCFSCTDLYFADLHRFVFGWLAFLCFVPVLTFYVPHLSAWYFGPFSLNEMTMSKMMMMEIVLFVSILIFKMHIGMPSISSKHKIHHDHVINIPKGWQWRSTLRCRSWSS